MEWTSARVITIQNKNCTQSYDIHESMQHIIETQCNAFEENVDLMGYIFCARLYKAE